VWPHGGAQGSDTKLWGNQDQKELSYCIPLLTRIEQMLTSSELACIFRPESKASVRAELDSFLKGPDAKVIRISLRHLAFEYNVREIAVNAIGRHLLDLGRSGNFREKPVVVFLDEAHQFLNKQLGDENSRYPLDSFELIAKEGRKFSLNVCISTQRPRDIPEGVLSQMGTLIVHRLTNDKDREIVERASGEIDQSAAAFLPTLAPGQAIVIGVDLPMPLTVQVTEPGQKPDSRGPDYQSFWRAVAPATPTPAASEFRPQEASSIPAEAPKGNAVR
jgi:DNA helicase HerA-like ATPase